MDYKKAYEDALERARSGMQIEEVFPELHESEDERIRKGLLNIFKESQNGHWAGIEIKDIVTWLEKQKEQKPAHTAKEMWKEMRLEVYAQASGNRHEPNYSDDSTKMFSLCDIDEIFEKIGNSTVGSQPAEWSEEDEKMLKDCSVAITSSDYYFSYEERCAMDDWLKSLRPQPHWKPNEKEIIAFENLLKGEFPDKIFPGATLSGLLGKLKMLYYNEAIPYWKPSEEQMEVLGDVITMKKGNEYETTMLRSLYNDLKKL